ncbi:O-succinylbenzoate-CoA ligase [Escherichia coli]|nr:O-succinylbenzoate-CoA ligase [Escherichia coli]
MIFPDRPWPHWPQVRGEAIPLRPKAELLN